MNLDHRVTYYAHRLPEPVELRRYTASDGAQLVVKSRHATLASVSQYEVRRGGKCNVHSATTADGVEGYILKVDGMKNCLQQTIMSRESHYCPAEEWGSFADSFFLTEEDALVCAGDSASLEQEWDRLRDMIDRAHEAAAAIDGEDQWGWSRAAYEAACAAAGVDAADDKTAVRRSGPGGGVFTIPDYHREHVAWADLALHRAAGVTNELKAAEATAQARAEQAAGSDAYTRSEYETACAAADIPPLPDAAIPRVAADHFFGSYSPVRDVLSELRSAELLGSTPRTAAVLAERRERGINAELAKQRERERENLSEQDHEFATQKQVDEIMRLLANRAASGEGGGFMAGPTDPQGVANLDRKTASLYITSLRGEY